MITGKLPLESSRWNELDCFGDPAQLPALIRNVERHPDPGKSEALEELTDAIYQQYSCCEAAYAVFPHLVEIGLRLQPACDPNLWINVGHIAGTCRGDATAPFVSAFEEALSAAQPHWIDVVLNGHWPVRTTYYLALSSIALTRNPIGKLFSDNFFPDKSAKSAAICSVCSERFFVEFSRSGSVVRPRGAAPRQQAGAHSPVALRTPLSVKLPQTSPNPWQRVAAEVDRFLTAEWPAPAINAHLEAARELAAHGVTATSAPGWAFSFLGSLLFLKGYPDAGMRYLHAWDEIACPICGAVFTFADRWWGAVN